ncbi:Tim44/TimA family putative adaptor protein [Roseomonas sp. NAR14]|uniref:Tim44/TimA family putative adaptor protein n=1 Tax=Roseomonas acroporae TaxID=2937791 RepID=A0A9X1YBY5_9PROT|nr:Tim44/TimA family putative adaptor protein [Roseomonas acroporae]MCK8785882.1 Tim44/TimA family putative adaptor protein [Roseomonas acroporae]
MQTGIGLDLILFGMIAAFLVLRLRSVLGRRTGFERPPQERPPGPGGAYDPRGARPVEGLPDDAPPAPAADVSRHRIPDPGSPVGQVLQRIQGVDQGFDPGRFLDGAEGAFRMIVTAFAAGDRATLHMLLSDETCAGFERAIAAREAAGEQQRTELRAVNETAIEAADLRGTIADITVRFVTDQINITTAKDGQVITGSDAVTEIVDIWTFQRDLTSADPAWKLVGTQSA